VRVGVGVGVCQREGAGHVATGSAGTAQNMQVATGDWRVSSRGPATFHTSDASLGQISGQDRRSARGEAQSVGRQWWAGEKELFQRVGGQLVVGGAISAVSRRSGCRQSG
jgi:hypothetical protein